MIDMRRWATEQGLRALRRRARLRHLQPGVTVVTVNWNTATYLQTQLSALRRYSSQATSVRVVDNASSDHSREVIRSAQSLMNVSVTRLPINIGHALGLHLGLAAVTTERFVLLDVDAFPISRNWLTELTSPLDDGAILVGAEHNGFAHPCCLAGRTRWFFDRHRLLSSQGRVHESGFLDVGERLTHEACQDGEVVLLPVTATLGPGFLGSVYGDIVYHNFYSAHRQGEGAREVGQVPLTSTTVESTWGLAVRKFLGELAAE